MPTSQCVISQRVNHAQLKTEHEANASYSGADGEDCAPAPVRSVQLARHVVASHQNLFYSDTYGNTGIYIGTTRTFQVTVVV